MKVKLLSILFVLFASVMSAQVFPPDPPSGPTLPATCNPLSKNKLLFFLNAAGASRGLYECTDVNTYTKVAAGTTGGVLTINTDGTSAHTIAAGTTGNDVSVATAGGTTTIHIPTASGTKRGALSSTDWTTFNSKEEALTFSGPLSRATNTISILTASGSQAGALSSTDWTTFNSKLDPNGSYSNPTWLTGLAYSKLSGVPSFARQDAAATFTSSVDMSGATATSPNQAGTLANMPGSCTGSRTYFATDATAGSNLYGCVSGTFTLLGGGSGNVIGPNSSIQGNIPKFGGTDGKVLADGYALVTTLGSPGSDTNVPSEKAVRDAVAAAGGGDVTASGTLTSGLPSIGAGSKSVAVGTKTGDTTYFVTSTGTQTSGAPVVIDASGNHVAASSAISGTYGGTGTPYVTFAGPSVARTYTLPTVAATLAALGVAQSWTANQTFTSGTFLLGGSSSGTTGFVPASAASGTITVPAETATMALLKGSAHGVLISQGTSTQAASTAAGSAGQLLTSGGASADPAWTTAVYPATTTVSQLLYSSSANTVTGLATGNSMVLVTNGSGVPAWGTTLPAVTLTTPTLGVATATSINKMAITAPATGSTLAVAEGKTFTVNNTLTLAGTDSTTMTFPGTSQTIPGMNQANTAGASFTLNAGSASATAGLKVPTAAGAIPTTDGFIANNSTNHTLVFGTNSATGVVAVAATGTNTATTCTNQVITAVSGVAVPTCTTLTTAYLPTASTIIDGIGSTRGSILYRGASGWTALTPGTSGYVLQSQGAGADPTYAAISGVISGLAGVHALVTSANSTSIETLNSSAVMDASGNITTPGTVSTGSGTGQAGQVSLTAGTSPASPPANSVSFAAPSAITTAYTLTLPTAAAASDSVPMFTSAGVGSFVALTGASGTIPRLAGSLVVASGKTLTSNVTMTLAGTDSTQLSLAANLTTSGANALTLTTTAPTNATLPSGTVTLMSDPMTTNGDMIARASGAATRVAGSSTANQPLLSVVGSVPVWGGVSLPPTTVTSGGVLYASSTTALASSGLLAQYGVVYGGGAGAAPNTTAAGTTGQLLVATSGAAPSWTTATYPSSTTINRILYSSSANAIGEISAVNGGMLNANSSGVPAMTVTPILGVPATSAGTLTFAAATGSGTVTIGAQNSTTSYNFKLPTTVGTAGYALTTDGTSGNLSWTQMSGGGTVNSGTAAQLAYYATSTNAVSGNANATISNGALTLGVATSVLGQLVLSGSTSGTVTVQPAVAAGNWTMTLPADDGTDGQLLKTNGSGVTSWVTATGTGDVLSTAANTYSAGMKQTVVSNTSAAGLNLGAASTAPSGPATGDMWFNSGGSTIHFRVTAGTKTLAFTDSPVLTTPTIATSLGSETAGSATVGTAALPFSSVYIGGAATNNIQLTGTAASAKVITLPGQTGTVTVAPTTTTANQHLAGTATAGLGAWSTSTYADTYAAGGLLVAATANTVTATPTPTIGAQGSVLGTLTLAGASTTNPSITLNGYTSGTGVLSVTATGTAITTSVPLSPTSAGGTTLGIAALPFSSVYIGGSATNNIRLTGTSAAARVATIPDVAADSTFVLAATSTTTTQALFASSTAGLGTYRAIAAGDLPATLSSGTAITNASLTTPSLGVATATSINKVALTAPTTAGTIAFGGDNYTATLPNGTVGQIVFSGTQALGTSSISANACATTINVTATGTASTDNITLTPNADWSAVTGYGKASTDGLVIYQWPTTNTVNIAVCNSTGTAITPGAATVNIRVIR